jgi:excinuclease ABC subunit C
MENSSTSEKAKDLKKRVRNYFQKRDHDPKTESLIQIASSLDFIVTTSKSSPCSGRPKEDYSPQHNYLKQNQENC